MGVNRFNELEDVRSGQDMQLGIVGQKLGFFGAAPVAVQAANADTSGAVVADLEVEVNQLKQIFRNYGLLA